MTSKREHQFTSQGICLDCNVLHYIAVDENAYECPITAFNTVKHNNQYHRLIERGAHPVNVKRFYENQIDCPRGVRR